MYQRQNLQQYTVADSAVLTIAVAAANEQLEVKRCNSNNNNCNSIGNNKKQKNTYGNCTFLVYKCTQYSSNKYYRYRINT